jgi:hypothetical protein
LNQNKAQADDEVRRMLHALSDEVQASLALSRAAVAAASSTRDGGVEEVLKVELDRARRLAASQRTAGILEQVQRRLRQLPNDRERADALAWALIAAADALPDAAARG